MSPTPDFIAEASYRMDQLRAWRRDFHRQPELAYQEHRSAALIAELLNSWGFEVKTGIAKTGILARLKGRGTAGSVLLRVDMDALPIQELNEVEYASITPGVMHACGHDGHMAIGLGVADVLRSRSDELKGDTFFVFQPAEEGGGGAEGMLTAGVLDGIEASMALGVHLWNTKPLGWFGVTDGSIMAGAERFELRVRGQGGHGAMPHLTRDPIVAAAAIVSAVQTLRTHTIDAFIPAVLSVTHIEGGSNFNVIPDEVQMEGTIRTLDVDTRTALIERFEQMAGKIAAAHGCSIDLEIEQVALPVVNDPTGASHVRSVVQNLFHSVNIDPDYRVMVSEDMAYFLNEIPGVFMFVGSGNEEAGLTAGHHTAHFDFDEKALEIAVAALSAVIWDNLKAHD